MHIGHEQTTIDNYQVMLETGDVMKLLRISLIIPALILGFAIEAFLVFLLIFALFFHTTSTETDLSHQDDIGSICTKIGVLGQYPSAFFKQSFISHTGQGNNAYGILFCFIAQIVFYSVMSYFFLYWLARGRTKKAESKP